MSVLHLLDSSVAAFTGGRRYRVEQQEAEQLTRARRSGLRWATVIVVIVIAAIAVGGALLTRRAAQSEERNLLNERASEIGLILTDAFSTVQTQLATVASETALNGTSSTTFTTATKSLLAGSPGSAVGIAKVSGPTGHVHFVTTKGKIPATATAPQAALIRRALTVHPVATTSSVFSVGSARVLGLAYPVGVHNQVVYEQVPLNPTAAGSATAQGQPFHELTVALYAGTTQSPSTLILTTSPNASVPLKGSVALARPTFGADTWLVAITATTPLIGNFAANAYWLVLAGGLLLALVLGALAEALLRRRDYAMTLVDERTEELRESLVKLEDAQERLVRQERLAAIGQLASAVGHELRNPLGVITNAHYLLRTQLEQRGDDSSGLRHLSTAEREVGAATLIVSDLLDFSRAREPVTAPVDLSDLLDEVESVIPPPANVMVSRIVDPAVEPALADRDQLRQVLLNLLTNGYEAMPDGGSIVVTVKQIGPRVLVSVADTGTGMDEETRGRVFEPFFTRKARGIGLGLAVTKRIVDGHGGAISVTSAPGEGTTFTVELPAAVREPAR